MDLKYYVNGYEICEYVVKNRIGFDTKVRLIDIV